MVGGVYTSFLLVGLTVLGVYMYNHFWLKLERLRKKLWVQGIKGPQPSFFYGNLKDMKRLRVEMEKKKLSKANVDRRVSHDHMSYLFPHLDKWSQDYGPVFMFAMGNLPILYVSDLTLVREICRCKSIDFGRSSYLKKNRGALLGNSIITAAGHSWVHQRRTLAPEFFMNKVKAMEDMMVSAARSTVSEWECKINEQGGLASVRVDDDLKNLSAEIISRACFGSFYAQGNEIFLKIRRLQHVLSQQFIFLGLPGLRLVRYIPTKNNRMVWSLDREIKSSILQLVKDHKSKAAKEEDLLQVLVESFGTEALIVDNCKAIFFAGHETTSSAVASALVLLAHHQEWQKRVRAEVDEICGGRVPTVDMLHKMKTASIFGFPWQFFTKIQQIGVQMLLISTPGGFQTGFLGGARYRISTCPSDRGYVRVWAKICDDATKDRSLAYTVKVYVLSITRLSPLFGF